MRRSVLIVFGLPVFALVIGACGPSVPAAPVAPLAAPDDAGRPTATTEVTATSDATASDANEPTDAASGEDPEAKSKAIVDEVLRSIREISPTEHAIGRHALELFLQNQDLLMKQARIVPDTGTAAPGKPATPSIRIFGVRPDSVLGRVGLQNGDRIERIMGKPVGTPEQALEAYAAMRNAKTIDIDVNRGGTSKKLLIRVE